MVFMVLFSVSDVTLAKQLTFISLFLFWVLSHVISNNVLVPAVLYLPLGNGLSVHLQSHCLHLLHHFAKKESLETSWAKAPQTGSTPPGPPEHR